jgi:hemoglobin
MTASSDSAPRATRTTLFDELGGEPVLRRVIDRFIDRVFDDAMIGFFFRNASRARVKAKEYEFAARHLGADLPYTGKPLREAHSPHPIMGGQFNRRLQILKETLEEAQVPAAVRDHWLAHTEALRSQVTRNTGNECDPARAGTASGGSGKRRLL